MAADTVTYSLTLPPGTTGRLVANPARRDVTLAGKDVSVPREGLLLPAGHHSITFRV